MPKEEWATLGKLKQESPHAHNSLLHFHWHRQVSCKGSLSPWRLQKTSLHEFLVVGNHLRAGEGNKGQGLGKTHERAQGTDFAGRLLRRDTGNAFLSGKDVHISSLPWYGAAWGKEQNRKKQSQRCLTWEMLVSGCTQALPGYPAPEGLRDSKAEKIQAWTVSSWQGYWIQKKKYCVWRKGKA